jgi:hypothetical protein
MHFITRAEVLVWRRERYSLNNLLEETYLISHDKKNRTDTNIILKYKIE